MRDMVRMVGVLTAVCVVAALGLAKVYDLTEEPIREALRQELLRAVRAVLPEFDNDPAAEARQIDGRTFYLARKGGEPVGAATEAASPEGYGGWIRALVGVDRDGRVTGVVILQHAETPGLGAKAADPGYLAQFKGKGLRDANWAVKKDGGDFDQITGATITPRALVKGIREALEAFEAAKARLFAPGGAG
ncbi:MAG: RnfABCDGE type electron transport complex subunit G [Candidatus Dadabacteria bacterium]|nr:MAG: RnfABCDGE type electron transport complex subunit G [Candidatus Dadabacteria bacterium]